MKIVKRDLESGVYRYSGEKVTIAEVLRRAQKSAAYLRKDQPGVAKLRERVQDFVDRANKLIRQGACSMRNDGVERAGEAASELKLVRQAYAEAEQEYSDLKQRYAEVLNNLEAAEKTIEELRAEKSAVRPSRDQPIELNRIARRSQT
ncbi:hypothetical protein BSZ22_07800 [Bradyrhizobium canariense]|uniref:Uncharacterized protein n=2 Tax=Bradyrhizobium canariense TaxID=255045 RepID=A0A1X3G0X5_9BRAD|nr:hypothetical protein BSZ22_07800 [Bradyrhizobium canariense]OSI79022.1 hypothetical protein BSZ23_16480 [Bradyrhizobium canariense]OSJ08262.1 hypothetical protein BSZ16_07625 [Bradyrhizobium canariense]OSJ15670.1 hypothetical protein BSZ18_07330 [Bradyrhizobium canariense]